MSAVEQTLEAGSRLRDVSGLRLQKWMPLAIFAASVLTTSTFLLLLPERFRADEGSDYTKLYGPVARSILAGRGFASATDEFSTVYPPGYPLIIAGVFSLSHFAGVSEQFGLLVLSVLAMGLVSLFVFSLARDMWGIKAAVISAILWMSYPFALLLTKQPNSELPFMIFLYGALLLFAYAVTRPASLVNFFVCGFLVGLGMLVRPIGILMPFVFCVILLFTRIRSARLKIALMTMLLLGSLVPVLPWEVLAYQRTGKIIPLSINAPRSIRDGLTYGVLTKGYRKTGVVAADVSGVMHNIAEESSDNSAREIVAAFGREAVAHPLTMVKLMALKIIRSWYGRDSGRREWPILIVQFCYLALVGWSISTVWRSEATHRWFILGIALITVYFWGMTILVLSTFRYMLPVMPLLFLLVGAAVTFRQSSRKRQSFENDRG